METADGMRLLRLYVGSKGWVHRRVDTFWFTEPGSVRRSVSLDLTLSPEDEIVGSRHAVVVPLGILPKEPLRGLQVRGPVGETLPVLTTQQNSILASSMMAAAMEIAGVRLKDDSEARLLHDLASCSVAQGPAHLAAFKAAIDGSGAGPGFNFMLQLAQMLSESFLFMVEMDRSLLGRRCILRYANDLGKDSQGRPEPGNVSEFEQAIPEAGFAQSQHIEVHVPEGVELLGLGVEWETYESKPGVCVERCRPGQMRAHVNTSAVDRFLDAHFSFGVRPAEQGLYVFTKWTVRGVVALVVVAVLIRCLPSGLVVAAMELPSPASSLLLIAPAILVSWVSRSPENQLAAATLRPLRVLNISCAAILFAVAFMAAVPLSFLAWNICWSVIYLFTVLVGWFWLRQGRRRTVSTWPRMN